MKKTPATLTKPLPNVEEDALRPFWEGALNGTLMIKRCTDCSAYQGPTAGLCIDCLSESLDWVEASGKGTLHAYGIMHQRYHPGFFDDIPYNVAVVELDEGPRLNTNILEVSSEDLQVGMRVMVTFERVTKEVAIPKFRPA